jgi:nicotinamidase-related amidase
MQDAKTALLLIGFQNDYFSKDGLLYGAIENPQVVENVITNTTNLLEALVDTEVLIVETPVKFTSDYRELDEPVGILKVIKDSGALIKDTYGSATIERVKKASANIITLTGKRGLNCFSNTNVDSLLKAHNIEHVIIAGAITSLCIDTAGREALDLGYKVSILSDCILSRTQFEQKYYIEEIMPLYSTVLSSDKLVESLAP